MYYVIIYKLSNKIDPCFSFDTLNTNRNKFSYCSKANTNSSLRVKIGASILNEFEKFDKYSLPSKGYVNKKRKRISNIKTIICENSKCFHTEYFKKQINML